MIFGTEATPCLAPAAENSTSATFTGRCSAAAFTTTRREPEYRQVTAPTVAAAAPNRNTRRVTFPVRSSLANPPSNIARILIQTNYIQRASPKPSADPQCTTMEIAPQTIPMLPHSRAILCYNKDSLPLSLSTISSFLSTRKALRGACAMKKKRLGEILRERNHVSVENLDKAIQDQQGKLVHLGELLLQRGAVSKADLVSALVETSRIPYFDCHSVEVDAETLQLITAAMARSCCALPLETVGNKLVVVMAEPQNLRFLDELRFKSGMQISPRLGFRAEVEAAIAINYASAESEVAAAVATAAATSTVVSVKEIVLSAADAEMEFISSSSQERNVEAMREMQSELMQKSRPTPPEMLAAPMINPPPTP